MGYTHSWYREKIIDPAIYASIVADFGVLIKNLPDEAQIIDTPDFWGTPGDIAFGGKTATCEPMVFCRISSARSILPERAAEPWQVGKYFEYCKTERLPYDLAACCFLIIAKKHLGGNIHISTDGSQKDWEKAIDLCQKAIGFGKNCCITADKVLKV